jgi:hypothetical protein
LGHLHLGGSAETVERDCDLFSDECATEAAERPAFAFDVALYDPKSVQWLRTVRTFGSYSGSAQCAHSASTWLSSPSLPSSRIGREILAELIHQGYLAQAWAD